MPHPLDSFFAPDSIALIGASRDLEKIPGRLLSMLRKNEYPGKIYPINPNYGDIDGLKCYAAIADVGQPIDLAIVIIPARAVLGALEQCAAVGVKNAVIISSGFAEEGGDSAAMQDAIVALAKRTGMRISGPNAEGFLSEVQKVAATFSPTVDVKPGHVPLVATRRRIAIVAQSGGIGFAIKHRAKALGVAISYCVSAGNESDLGAGEFLDYMVQDASTDVILLFIEGIRDVDKFLAAAQRAAETGKPVIVTKVGRSGAGERAAASHTASMAGWSAAYDAVFAKYGFIISNDLDEAVTIAAALTTNPLPKGDRVAVLTVSGGAGIWGADTVALQGLQVPELSARIQTEIKKLLPSYGAAGNPIDVTAQGVHSGGLQKSIDLLSASDEVDAILVVLSLSSDTRMPFKQAELKPVIDAQHKPIVFYSYTLPSHFARSELAACGAVVLSGLTHAGVALRRMVERAKFRLAPPADAAAMPSRDLSAHLKSADALGIRQQGAAARCRHCVAGRSAGDGKERAGRRGRPVRLSAGHEDPVARHPAQERSRRRARRHRDQGRGVPGLRGADGQRATAPAGRRHSGRAGRPDGEKGRRDHHRHDARCDLRGDDHGRPRRRHHGIVPRRGLPPRAGQRGGSFRHAGRVEGRAPAERVSRSGEGGRCGAVAIDRAGLGAGGATRPARFPRSRSIRCWCIRRGRASRSSMRWWCGRRSGRAPASPAFRGARQREPGISFRQLLGFRVHRFAMSRNDGVRSTAP